MITHLQGGSLKFLFDELDRLKTRTDAGFENNLIAEYIYIGRTRVATIDYQNDTRATYGGGSEISE